MRYLWLCTVVFVMLCITTVQAQGVTLAWDYTQGSTPAVKFRVYRQPSCVGAFVALTPDVVPVGSTPATYTFVDSAVVVGQTYCWNVTAVAADTSESEASNIITLQIQLLCVVP